MFLDLVQFVRSLSITPNVKYMASWGLKCTNLSACKTQIKSANVSNWNDTPNLLYTLLGCVYYYQNGKRI
jgi:hypothetical protein